MTPRRFSGLLLLAAAGACKEPTPPPIAGPPAQLAIHSGNNQMVPANTVVPSPASVILRDADGVGVPGQQITFSVIEGGGSISGNATVTTDANGVATAPSWRMGKSNVPQRMRATHGSWSRDITATIQTSYRIEVRFFGQAMTTAQQALFTAAARRLEAIVTGDVPNVLASNLEIHSDSTCGVTDAAPLNETIDDIVIYAAIDSIDGPGSILAQAGPCYIRTGSFLPIVGTMFFDEEDLETLTGAGSLQDVITHEMMHVLGFGTIWQDKKLLTGAGTADPRFTGAQARAGCVAVGGTVSCASSVPVEGTPAPAGTRDGHWRESVFNTEIMTGSIDAGALPISSVTIGSLADVGYTVNSANNDPYVIFIGALRADDAQEKPSRGWDEVREPRWQIGPDGRPRKLDSR